MSKYIGPVELDERNISPAEIDIKSDLNLNKNQHVPADLLKNYLDHVSVIRGDQSPVIVVTRANDDSQHEQAEVDKDPYLLIAGLTTYYIAVQRGIRVTALVIPYDRVKQFTEGPERGDTRVRKLRLTVDLCLIQHYLFKARIETHLGYANQYALEELAEIIQ